MDQGGLGPDCKWLIGGMSAAIIGLCGAIAYCANGWLKAVIGRVTDRDDRIAQLNAAQTMAVKKKEGGGSP